jgi:F-type H+-transporting ATPase subunit epsilon
MAEADANKVQFELVSPERLLVSQAVDMVVVPGEEGDFGVLPGHALLMTQLRPWVVEIYDGDAVTDRVFVAGGFAEVTPRRCTVLAEEALSLADVGRDTAASRLSDAEQAVGDARDDDERSRAESEQVIAAALVEALDYYKIAT